MTRGKTADMTTRFQRQLTDRELRFVEEYCIDLDVAAAMRRCGVTDPNAGHRLMHVPEVQQAVDVRLVELSRRAVSSAGFVRDRLTEVVERCMQKEPVMERGIDPATGKTGNIPTGEWAFNAQGANKALELLGRYHGMFADKVVITVEHELKGMPQVELDARIHRMVAEHLAIDMQPGLDGVYSETPKLVQLPPVSTIREQDPELNDAIEHDAENNLRTRPEPGQPTAEPGPDLAVDDGRLTVTELSEKSGVLLTNRSKETPAADVVDVILK